MWNTQHSCESQNDGTPTLSQGFPNSVQEPPWVHMFCFGNQLSHCPPVGMLVPPVPTTATNSLSACCTSVTAEVQGIWERKVVTGNFLNNATLLSSEFKLQYVAMRTLDWFERGPPEHVPSRDKLHKNREYLSEKHYSCMTGGMISTPNPA